jgi:uncharacterized SAM-binding protein YcdF (DUF218 family)
MKWNRIVLLIGIITMAGLLLVIGTPVTNIAGQAMAVPSEMTSADAIVVLASGLMRDGSLGNESARRFLYGMRLYKRGLAPLLILSGPAAYDTPPESTVRSRIAAELGIPPSAIIEMSDVRTTREEARTAAGLLKPRHLGHVLLVTDPLHMKRAKLIFEAAGLIVSPVSSDNFPALASSPLERLYLLQSLAMQSAGLLYYRIAGYI